MPFEVMDAQCGLAQGRGEGTRQASPDQQSASQTGASRIGHQVDISQPAASLIQDLLHQRQSALDMVAAGQLRHHTAIGLVQIYLAVQGMRQQPWPGPTRGVDQGNTRFVATRFDTQYTHERQCKVGAGITGNRLRQARGIRTGKRPCLSS